MFCPRPCKSPRNDWRLPSSGLWYRASMMQTRTSSSAQLSFITLISVRISSIADWIFTSNRSHASDLSAVFECVTFLDKGVLCGVLWSNAVSEEFSSLTPARLHSGFSKMADGAVLTGNSVAEHRRLPLLIGLVQVLPRVRITELWLLLSSTAESVCSDWWHGLGSLWGWPGHGYSLPGERMIELTSLHTVASGLNTPFIHCVFWCFSLSN